MRFEELESDTGYVTLHVGTDDIKKLNIPTDWPKNIRLRMFVTDIEHSIMKKIISIIKKQYNVLDVSINPRKVDPTTSPTGTTFDIGDLTDINVQNTLISEWLVTNRPNVSDEMVQTILGLNKRINGLIQYSDQSRNIRWKPNYFKFSNLFSFGEGNYIDFTTLRGTHGIFAPNASGKSSSMEALIYTLFDKTPRAYKGDHIMNIRKKTFECLLSFDINGITYVIKRIGKKNKHGVVKVNVEFWQENADGSKTILNGEDRFSTNANIRSVVGTYEDFILTTLSGQNGNSLFIDKSNSERKNLLNQFMGVNIFEMLWKVANEETKEIQGVLKKFSREDFTDKLVTFQTELESLNIDLLKMQSEIDDRGREFDELTTEIETLSTQKINIPITHIDRKKLRDAEDVHIRKRGQLLSNIDVLRTEMDLVGEKIKALEGKHAGVKLDRLREVNETHQENEKQSTVLQNELNLATRTLESDRDTFTKLSQYQWNPECEVCLDNNREFVDQTAELTTKIQISEQKVATITADLQQLNRDLKDSYDQFSLYNTILSDNKALEQHRLDYDQSRVNIGKYENQLSQTNNETQKISEAISNLDQYEESLMKNKIIEDRVMELKNRQLQLKTNITQLGADKMEIHSDIKVREAGRAGIMDQLAEISEIEKEFEAYKFYSDAINKDGLPYDLISKTIPSIESEINAVLSQIVPFSIALDVDGKNFGGRIVYDHERSWPLENSSGMERFISSLAIRVALLKVSNLPKSNFLIIDEGMGSLDSEYLHGMQLMFDILKVQFEFIIIISHLDNVRDMVDDIIEITTVKGYSHINTIN
jgi:DNA repair exonuclease SbcCD ATPase subunit